MLLAGAVDRVKPGAPVVFARPPFAFDESLLLEPKESRIDRALVQRQYASRHLFDTAGNSEAVQWPKSLQGFKDHQVERAIGDIRGLGHASLLLTGHMSVPYLHVESQHERNGAFTSAAS